MKTVPLLRELISRLDLHAVYRRPDSSGITLTGALPLRRHEDWTSKGFDYANLATLDDLALAAPFLKRAGFDAVDFAGGFDRAGRFNIPLYLESIAAEESKPGAKK